MVTIIILVSISLIFLYIGLMLLEKAKRLKATGKEAMAIVIKNNFKNGNDDHNGMYHPVVQFITKDNKLIIRELDFGSTSKRDLNTEIPILYNPVRPQEVQINSALHLNYLPWFFILTGGLITTLVFLELVDLINFTEAIFTQKSI